MDPVGWVARLCCSWLSPGKATRISHERSPNGTIQLLKLVSLRCLMNIHSYSWGTFDNYIAWNKSVIGSFHLILPQVSGWSRGKGNRRSTQETKPVIGTFTSLCLSKFTTKKKQKTIRLLITLFTTFSRAVSRYLRAAMICLARMSFAVLYWALARFLARPVERKCYSAEREDSLRPWFMAIVHSRSGVWNT